MKSITRFLTFCIMGSLLLLPSCSKPNGGETDGSTDTKPQTESQAQTQAPTESPKKQYTEKTFRMATYNMYLGGAGSANRDMTRFVNDIIENDLDVIAFQEVYKHYSPFFYQDPMKIIQEKLAEAGYEYQYCYAACEGSEEEGERMAGNAVLSRYPIVDYKDIALTKPEQLPEGWVPAWRLLEAVLYIDGKEVAVYSVHCDQGLIKTQLSEIYKCAKEHDAYIIGGDFNYPTSDAGFADFNIAFNNDIIMANNASNPLQTTTGGGYKFDNILVSRDRCTIKNITVKDTGNSDHCLLYADVTVKFPK